MLRSVRSVTTRVARVVAVSAAVCALPFVAVACGSSSAPTPANFVGTWTTPDQINGWTNFTLTFTAAQGSAIGGGWSAVAPCTGCGGSPAGAFGGTVSGAQFTVTTASGSTIDFQLSGSLTSANQLSATFANVSNGAALGTHIFTRR